MALIAAFEIAVLAMIAMPQVDAQYRAVFINRTSDCWPHPVSGVIEPDTEVSFIRNDPDSPVGPAGNVLRCGWIEAEATGTWSLGKEARLLIALPPGRRATLEISVLPFGERQRVKVTANGDPVAEWTLTKEGSPQQTIDLPPTENGQVELALHFPDAISPQEQGMSDDDRKLAVRLIHATLTLSEMDFTAL